MVATSFSIETEVIKSFIDNNEFVLERVHDSVLNTIECYEENCQLGLDDIIGCKLFTESDIFAGVGRGVNDTLGYFFEDKAELWIIEEMIRNYIDRVNFQELGEYYFKRFF
jgi:hypothetical protein